MTGLAVEAEVSLSVGGVHDAVHGALKKHHGEKPKPSYLRRAASVISDGSHLNVLDFGAPPSGRLWQVTYVTLFGSDDHTVVATIVGAVYTGNPNSLALGGLIIPSLPFPSATQISDDVLWVHSNENLCVQTSVSGALGQQLGGNVVILEWREAEITQRFGN